MLDTSSHMGEIDPEYENLQEEREMEREAEKCIQRYSECAFYCLCVYVCLQF